jgi:hypothetical protein
MVSLGLRPYDGNGFERNPSLVFPILEMLLGGKRQSPWEYSAGSHRDRAEAAGWSLSHHSE